MSEILFTHQYPKLWGQKKGLLLAVLLLDAKGVSINKDLIEYDTKYEDKGKTKYYELPKEGKLIQLIFVGEKDIPFCTLRSYNELKWNYYQGQIGKVLDIKVRL